MSSGNIDDTQTWQEKLATARRWLQAMERQGEDYIWRGAMDAVSVLDEIERERVKAADRIDALEKALKRIPEIERQADELRGSGMVDDVDVKAIRAMSKVARAALTPKVPA